MTEGDRERLTGALEVWLEHHPDPDRVFLQLAEGAELTPRQVVGQIAERTDLGERLLQVFDSASERVPLSEMIEDLTVTYSGEPQASGR